MSLEVKAMLVMAPLCSAAMAYALIQGNWENAAFLAFILVLMFIGYRAERRSRSARAPEHRKEV